MSRSLYSTSGIYQILNTKNGKSYIGSATRIGERWSCHRAKLRGGYHHSIYLQNAWNKYGESAFEFKAIILCEKKDLLTLEEKAIKKFKPEYNIAQAARGGGSTFTEKMRAQISSKLMGHPVSEETKKRMSDAAKKRTQSEEARKELARRGALAKHDHSEDSKQKMSEIAKKRVSTEKGKLQLAEALRARWARYQEGR